VKELESTATSTVTRRYTWGLDLAGVRDHESLDASGGIGGLLAIRERVGTGPETTRYVISDPQGNVMALADPAGTLVARFDYDPFGRLIMETGEASSCPFRYSTKYRDPDLELYCYGHRWYDPSSMKWLTPDPIGERGGANLTAFCANDPVNKVDALGLELIVLGRMDSPASGETWLISDEIAADLGLSGLNGADGDRVAYIDVEWTSISVLKDAAFRNATEDEKFRMELIRAIEARMEEVSRHRNAYLRSWEQGAPLYMVAAPYRSLEAEYDWLYHLRRDVVYEGRPIARFFVDGGDDPWFVAGMMSTTYNGVRLTTRGIRSWRAARTAPKKPVWGSWADYRKVSQGGREYAQVGDRLYTRHAVDRMQPSGLGAPAGAENAGRSIAPSFVDDAIQNGTTTTRIVDGVKRTIHTSGSVQVVTEQGGKIVVTINPFSGGN
jgi:RHS repeat-associated protein